MRIVLLAALAIACLHAQESFPGAAAADEQINSAIKDGLIPGAVLLVGHDGKIVYLRAYGERAVTPRREPMTVDTIFDIASLTKVVATTPSVMKLLEQGKIRLDDPVTRYLPDFEGGRSSITIRNLMTHFSGLRPDLDLQPAWTGYDTGIHRALMDKPEWPAGVRFEYSDINFILLGEIVHRVSGKMLNQFARENVFEPLGMRTTTFLPPAEWRPRIAPTEIDPATGLPLRGIVHDDTTRYMGGVAGQAGVFSTADDLAKYAQMLLDRGQIDGKRLFNAATVEKFVSPESPADQPILRGLGWDIDSPYSSPRGDLFPIGSYGHTGYTGTSLWIDPFSRSYVILLSNSVHPRRGKNINTLRSRIATIAATSFGITGPEVKLAGYNETITGPGLHRLVQAKGEVRTGLDVLARENFAPLRGKRIGLITNHTGLDRNGKRNIDLMLAAGIRIVALFSPEHGLFGNEDQPNIANSKDAASGIPVYSLFQGTNRRIAPERLENVDALVFDIQDVGARFYTYSCTMLYSMEEAAKRRLPFFVLDRPNPITGTHIEGPMMDPELESFVGCMEIPLRHGMTLGELAKMANAERKIGARLEVISMEGWNRGDWFDSTGLTWVDPSPNMRSLNAALLYPGVAMLEGVKNLSVGRGTDASFEQIGADWIHGRELASFLNGRYIPGIRVYPTQFQPTASNFAQRMIEGVRLVINDRNAFDSTHFGFELGYALEKLYPGKLSWDANRFLIGNREILAAEKEGVDPRSMVEKMRDSVASFARRRDQYLLYR